MEGQQLTQFDKRILFFTGNGGKVQEVQKLLGSNFEVNWEKCDIPETQGTYPKLLTEPSLLVQCAEISRLKACCIVSMGVVSTEKFIDGDVYLFGYNMDIYDGFLIEDTSLYSRELLAPGPFIKGWSNEALWKAMKHLDDKTLVAVCIFTLSLPNGQTLQFEGQCEGTICSPEEGCGLSGFGWDQVFRPNQNNPELKSFAQMTTEEKNVISHRAIALTKFTNFMKSQTQV